MTALGLSGLGCVGTGHGRPRWLAALSRDGGADEAAREACTSARHPLLSCTDTTRSKLSALWAVGMFNLAFADVVGFVHPGALQRILEGAVGFEITQELLLVFSVLLEVPILVVFLSLVLFARADRWLSTGAAVLTTAFVVGGGSGTLSYVFFAAVEIAAMSAVVWYSWTLPASRSMEPRGAMA